MNFRLSEVQLAHLAAIGRAIDDGRRPTVFDGGLVSLSKEDESEVIRDGAARQEARSATGSWQGQRARARSGANPANHPFRSEAHEQAHGAEFRILAQAYHALAFEDRNGLWVVASSNPLGRRGPQVEFLIAIPLENSLAPRSWAFERNGGKLRLASLKHTNFPDASICAFVQEEYTWPNTDGLVGLVDIYTLWMIRKWHCEHFGWWPGPQYGSCSHYRLNEFDPREDCGCGSNKRYGDCHFAADKLADPAKAAAEFKRLFGSDYDERHAPEQVLEAAKSGWSRMPSMATVFAHRRDPTGAYMI